MNLIKWFKKRKESDNRRDEYLKGIDKHKYSFYDLYTPELLEWIAVTNDPILLASAHHLINCWEWPSYMPKPKPEFNIDTHGWNDNDYKSIVFSQKLMEQLKQKAEVISPGLSQSLWMTNYYRKFSKNFEVNATEN